MPRQRTAKSLGQRHDLHYFQRWTCWRVVRAALMIATPLLAAAWLLGYAAHRNATPYISGPLASVHSFTGQRCESCHAPVLKAGAVHVGFRKHVTDDACLSCHRAPAHQEMQAFTPTCGSCHLEHVGSQHLRQVADESCVQCHGDLKLRSGSPHFQTVIYNFNSSHPEFAPLRTGFRDPGTIKLNHAIHMRAGLLGPNSQPVQLQCQDCHRPAADQSRPWKYGEVQLLRSTAQVNPHNPPPPPEPTRSDLGRAYMAAPTYASACQSCHTLQFDSHLSESVPHDTPQVVHEFVVAKLTDYIRRHPEAVHESPRPIRIMFGGSLPRKLQQARIARNPEEWIRLRMEEAETLLWRKTCAQCHTVEFSGEENALPKIAPANMKTVWLPNSVFSHYAHAGFDCKSCHTRAAGSQETSDVLIPSIQTCRQCHNGNPVKLGQTQNGCFLCHQYHNWKTENVGFVQSRLPADILGFSTDGRPRPGF